MRIVIYCGKTGIMLSPFYLSDKDAFLAAFSGYAIDDGVHLGPLVPFSRSFIFEAIEIAKELLPLSRIYFCGIYLPSTSEWYSTLDFSEGLQYIDACLGGLVELPCEEA